MLILLWGLPGDSPLAAVQKELQNLGIPHVLLNQREILETEVKLSVGEKITGEIWTSTHKIDLSAVTGVYLRPHNSYKLPEIMEAGPESYAWQHATAVDNALLSWVEMTSALILNRPSAMAANNSKPYQLQQICKFGFQVPETLVTTSPNAVNEFWQDHGSVIYKSVSSTRSKVSQLRPEHTERLDNVASCPTQFQQYIPGRDYRVHVVGGDVFACAISSAADDYRYAGVANAPEIFSCRLPEDIENKCRLMAAEMELSLAGIDLRETPEGEWYCFEVNPSPGFTYYQQETNQPISNAIARLLASGLYKSKVKS
ncbi:MAG: RimK domain-containing protein ATP-grasp [Okeania sp. SIO2C9]|uniref:ATP-grasp domain-containing protein n=1 Tax=Okeania sp. SIO2C9 TaxID=2607791 RepID=UPI0013C2117B|nr:RimK domain-containing protein ATP-grasp [Okeania sp. SIO2C9]NEQ72869.1 RimK domain-containing protein ATP-grasp [Okeania sp. SIO2C9]